VLIRHLINGDIGNAMKFLALDTLYLFAIYFDPSYEYFISPAEVHFLKLKSFYDAMALVNGIGKICNI